MAQQGTTREWQEEMLEQSGDGLPLGETVLADIGNRELIGALLGEAAMVLDRIGGVIVIGAKRREVAPGMFETVELAFKWDSYGGPAERLPREESEPEPVAAE